MSDLLFPFADYWWFYLAFLGLVAGLLALDLGVFHREAHVVSLPEAAGWSVFWVLLSLAFNAGFYWFALESTGSPELAQRLGLEFLTGYVVEKALAVDNIFVIVMVFAAFGIPALYQHRVLFYGIVGAILFRGVFIAIGAKLMAYHAVIVVFGVFLIATGVKMLFVPTGDVDPSRSRALRWIKSRFPVTPELHGDRFFVVRDGVRFATPLFVALVFVELTDLVFAVDSVPAIFAITREPLIVFTSNILAVLGLRSMYFLLAGVVDRFVYLKYGLASVLVFVGLKMAWLNGAMGGKFPIGLSLGIIATLIGGSIAASLWATRGGRRAGPSEPAVPAGLGVFLQAEDDQPKSG
jgi:tellurite resistance protein TerC